MFCDSNGRRDENGDFELINGTICLRDGRQIGVSATVFLTDAASRGRLTLTDAERNLAKAKALRDWTVRHAWMRNPPPFTQADEARAIEDAARQKMYRATLPDRDRRIAADTAAARADMKAAYEAHKISICSAWKAR